MSAFRLTVPGWQPPQIPLISHLPAEKPLSYILPRHTRSPSAQTTPFLWSWTGSSSCVCPGTSPHLTSTTSPALLRTASPRPAPALPSGSITTTLSDGPGRDANTSSSSTLYFQRNFTCYHQLLLTSSVFSAPLEQFKKMLQHLPAAVRYHALFLVKLQTVYGQVFKKTR